MKPHTLPLPSEARRQQGFSLVELAMVLLVVGLLAGLFLPATNTMLDNNRRNETRTKLEALEAAMTRFVMTNRRLPCPANGTLGIENLGSGLEQRNAGPPATCTAMTTGVVPWRTLGMPVDSAIDAWGNLITYRVWARTAAGVGSNIETSLAMNRGMDMSECRPTSSGEANVPDFLCSATSSVLSVLIANSTPPPAAPVPTVLQSRGFRACSLDNCPATAIAAAPGANELTRRVDGNGVAYFLISHGANKFGGFNPSGTLTPASGAGPGPLEDINENGQPIRTASPNDFYIDTDIDPNEATYYDDIVLRPTVMKVALDAGLGPRVSP